MVNFVLHFDELWLFSRLINHFKIINLLILNIIDI